MSPSTNPSSAAADEVTVLTYHAIAARPDELERWTPGARLYVFTLDELCQQLDHLAAEGFSTIAMADLVRWHRDGAELPERPIVVSFDDGHRSNAELAVPALADRGQKAIFFVTAGRVGAAGTVSWEQMRGLLDRGMEVGSHTLTHPCPSSLGRDALRHELAESKRVLEEGLGTAVDLVASPTGYDSGHFGELARDVGYQAAVQGVIGRNARSTDLFALRRFVLKRTHGFETFRRLVDPDDTTYVALRRRQAARNVVRRLLGVKGYEKVRALILGCPSGQGEG